MTNFRIKISPQLGSALLKSTYVRFIGVGSAAALGYFVICYLLQRIAGWPPFWASVAAYAIMFGFAYVGQRNIAFRSARRHRESLPAYLLLQVVCALLAAGIAQLLATTTSGPSPFVASAIATAFAGATSYVVSATWIFFDHREARENAEKASRDDKRYSVPSASVAPREVEPERPPSVTHY
ncbi:MAG: GtrA family protein [Acidobacteriaceae bacterium]|nr:GtrA family protein [Acidobacteriaceae bacterium]MBV9754856.1 GtrA family protein [Hyphomicrobiales bacterium]